MIEFCNGQVEALEGDLAHYSDWEEEGIKLAALMAKGLLLSQKSYVKELRADIRMLPSPCFRSRGWMLIYLRRNAIRPA